jgi:hypothetical protein
MSGEPMHPVESLSALLDGEVTDRERRALEAHLAACPPCRDRLEDLRVIDRALGAEAVPPVPESLAARIRERLEERAPLRATPLPSTTVATAARSRRVPLAAAASLLAAGLLWLLRSEMPLTPVPAPPETRTPGHQERLQAERSDAEAAPHAAAAPPAAAVGERAHEARPRDAKPQRRPGVRLKEEPAIAFETARSADAPAKDKKILAEDVAANQALRSLGYIGPAASSSGAAAEEKEPAAVEAPPYRVRLLPDRQMSVETAGYTCVVPITREDAVSLAAIVGEARTRQQKAVQAAQTVPQAASEETARPATATAPAAPPPGFSQAGPPRVCADLSPDECRFVQTLVRERYRLPIAERCGPPPR